MFGEFLKQKYLNLRNILSYEQKVTKYRCNTKIALNNKLLE